jgi:hypothetical protein
MTYWTLGQAAKETGKSKSQIHKAIAEQRLSYAEKSAGGYKLDPAEVFRVFPPERSQEPEKERSRTDENAIENRLLEQKVKFLEEQLREAKSRADDIGREKERLLQIVERQTMLIEDHSKKSLAEAERKATEANKSFWARVVGTRA